MYGPAALPLLCSVLPERSDKEIIAWMTRIDPFRTSLFCLPIAPPPCKWGRRYDRETLSKLTWQTGYGYHFERRGSIDWLFLLLETQLRLLGTERRWPCYVMGKPALADYSGLHQISRALRRWSWEAADLAHWWSLRPALVSWVATKDASVSRLYRQTACFLLGAAQQLPKASIWATRRKTAMGKSKKVTQQQKRGAVKSRQPSSNSSDHLGIWENFKRGIYLDALDGDFEGRGGGWAGHSGGSWRRRRL